MIRYACPKCDTSLKSNDDTAGTTTACPRCGERFEVPEGGGNGNGAPRKGKGPEPKAAKGAKGGKPGAKNGAAAKKGGRAAGRGAAEGGSKTSPLVFVGIGVGVLALAGVAVAVVVMQGKKPAETTTVAQTSPQVPPTPTGTTTPKADTNKGTTQTVTTPTPPGQADPAGQTVYQKLLRSTVWIASGGAEGSGSLVDKKNKLVLTNFHVISESQRPGAHVRLMFPLYENGELIRENSKYQRRMRYTDEGGVFNALVAMVDKTHDLALVKFEGTVPDTADTIRIAAVPPEEGDEVHSMGGNPEGSDGMWVYTHGTVRQVYHAKWGYNLPSGPIMIDTVTVETQSPINAGDSGGPLVNGQGHLVGVTSGHHRSANQFSRFIAAVEVRALLRRYYKETSKEAGAIIIGEALDMEEIDRHAGDLPWLRAYLSSNATMLAKTHAVELMGNMGRGAQAAIPDLITGLRAPDDAYRTAAATALGRIRQFSAADMKAIIAQAAKESNLEVRGLLLDALGEMGSEADDVVKPIAGFLKDPDTSIRQRTAVALGKIGSPSRDALPQLREATKDKAAVVRAAVAEALGKIGAEARPAIGAVAELLTDPNGNVQVAALGALEQFGADAKDAIPGLRKALRERNPNLQRGALRVFRAIGPDVSEEAAADVARKLDDADLADQAQEVLVSIGKNAVKGLVAALASSRTDARVAACRALADIGPDAKAAVPALKREAAADNGKVSREATKAIARIGAK